MRSVKELKSSESAKLDVELILCKVLEVDRLYIHLNVDKEIREEAYIAFERMLEERKKGRPMAYILGYKEFMGLDFFVKEGVLIPRPDTEIVVEEVIHRCKIIESPLIIDIGTGSGAISVSLAKYIQKAKIYSLDISDIALEVGKINAEKHKVENQITFLKSDVFSALEETNTKVHIVVSNPPYIRKKDIENLAIDVKRFEPLSALDGGEDGLYFYRKITKESRKYLRENGSLAFEVGHDQAMDVKNILIENAFKNIKILKDLSGIDRVVIGEKI